MFLALAYLGYTGFASGATYYYEVGEFLQQVDSVRDINVKVHGNVVPGTVEQGPLGKTLEFEIEDIEGGARLPVFYQGVVPDTFKTGIEIVVEGQLDASGVFQGHTLMPKCPSKYTPG